MRAEGVMLGDHEPELAEYIHEDITSGLRDFWGYVDSESMIGPDFETGWVTARNAACLATRSDSDRCRRPLLPGMPFCDFHIGDAARAMRAYFEGELERHLEIDKKRRLRWRMDEEITVGKIADANTVLREANRSVYFFLVPGRAVKIGYSQWPRNRESSLRNKGGGALCPEGLDTSTGYLYAVIGGGRSVEGHLHRTLHGHRIVGEWFRLTQPVLAAMEVAKAEQDRFESEVAA